MSLGIRTLWRTRATFIGGPGISTIPREPRRWCPPASSRSNWMVSGRARFSSTEQAPSRCEVQQDDGREGSFDNEAGLRPFAAQSYPTVVGDRQPRAVAQPHTTIWDQEGRSSAEDEIETQSVAKAQTTKSPYRRQNTPPGVGHLEAFIKDVDDGTLTGHAGSESSAGSPVESQQDSVLVVPAVRYPHPNETARSRHRHDKSVTRQLRLEMIRRATQKPLPDWRVVLDNLRRMTVQRSGPWRENAIKVAVSTRVVDLLIYGIDNSIWDIFVRTGCQITYHRKESAVRTSASVEGDGGYMILSGDQISLDEAVAEISQIAGEHSNELTVINLQRGNGEPADSQTIPTTTQQEIGETVLNNTNVGHRPSYLPRYDLCHRAEDIPKPNEWTRETFAAYIAALTRADLPSNLSRRFYDSGVAADEAFLTLMHKAFNDETARAALSNSAFKMALEYMESRGHSYRAHARALFVRMEMLSLSMGTDVFNILLESSVKVRDLRSFDAMLKLMIARGHSPNLDTWGLFLQVIESEEVKRHIVTVMHSRGLLEGPRAMQMVARELVGHDIRRASVSWPGIQTFLKDQDSKYGSGWMTTTAMNRIMNELGRLGKLSSAREFLDLMLDSDIIQPTTIIVNILLAHARTHGNIALALVVLHRAHKHGIKLDETSYHELTGLATGHRKLNMLAVIWLHASLNRKTSYPMRVRFSELVSKINPRGRNPPVTGLSTLLPNELISELNGEPNTTRRRQGERSSDWVPELPLHALLESALDLDRALELQVKDVNEPLLDRSIEIKGLLLTLRRRDWAWEEEKPGRKYLDTTPLVYILVRNRFRKPSFALVQAEPRDRDPEIANNKTKRYPPVRIGRNGAKMSFRKLYAGEAAWN